MDIYINGVPRADIRLESGGQLSMESSHTASSSVTLVLPSSSEAPRECDAMAILDDGGNRLYAGTVMQAVQEVFPHPALSYKRYSLVLSDNSELLASTLVDMTFSAGANMMQILFGNQPDSAWYDGGLPSFHGILPARMQPEGIAAGTIDDFSVYVLSEPANLWGMYLRDALDALCEIAGAWWTVTPDKQFVMQYRSSTEPAPFSIGPSSDIFDVSVSKDAFTLCSAVRVVGGVGAGAPIDLSIESGDTVDDGAAVLSDTVIQTRYPIREAQTITLFDQKTHEFTYITVGPKGIGEGCDAYYTSGSDTIEIDTAATAARFPIAGSAVTVQLSYVPEIRIYCRMVDEGLREDVARQRGGSGIIEQILEDDHITSYEDAVSAAQGYLNEAKKRAVSITFSTFAPGWKVGQTLEASLPYYGVSGAFQVVSASYSPLLQQDGRTRAVCTVEISNVPLRQKSGVLFYKPQSIAFSVGTDFPNTKSLYYENTIRLTSEVSVTAAAYPAWGEVSGKPWADYQGRTWGSFSTADSQTFPGVSGLTDAGRTRWAQQLYSPDGTPPPPIDLAGTLAVAGEGRLTEIRAREASLSGGSLSAAYFIDVEDCQYPITALEYRQGGTVLWSLPVSIDKTESPARRRFSLAVRVTHTVSGAYLTPQGAERILAPLAGGEADPFIDSLLIDEPDPESGSVSTTLPPVSTPPIRDGGFQLAYILYEFMLNTRIESAAYQSGPQAVLQFPMEEDRSPGNPNGRYQLNLIVHTQLQ